MKSASGKQVSFGTTISWKLPPLVPVEAKNRIETVASLWIVLICIALVISIVLAAFKGSLVSTWLFINTMQLIAHIPMIAGKLPANAHYFFLNFMSLARMSIQSVDSLLDDIESKTLNARLVQDEDSYLTAEMHSFGYSASFTRNALTILCFASVIALVWLFSAVYSKLCKKESDKQTKAVSGEVFMNNFFVRFLLEACFELMICAFINLSSFASTSMTGSLLSLFSLAAIAGALLFIGAMFVKGGPNVAGTYAPGTFLASLWGVRPLHEEV